MPARRPVAAAASCGQRMGDLGAVDDFGQQAAPARKPERLDHRVVVVAVAEIAEGEARLRRVGRAHIR